MEKENEYKIRKILLTKLFNLGCWGKGHVCERNLAKGFPKHLRGYVLEIAKQLRKDGYLILHPSGHDRQWYLNREKRIEIEQIISEK